jgi:hypothetical protein
MRLDEDATRRLDEDVNTDEDEEIDRMADGGGSTSSGAGRAGAAAAPAAARAGAPRAPRREPLADDVTVDELAAKEKKPKASRKASSDNQYNKSARKWWPKFIAYAGWNSEERLNFLNADGTPRDGTFRQLFIYLYEQNVTVGVFKPMLAWAQAELNKQRTARMLSPLDEHICKLPGIKERKDEIYNGRREQHIEHMTDLQADLEGDIGFDKMQKMVIRCLELKIPHTSPMFCLQTYFELRATHQQAARHDDLREEVFAHMFTRKAKVSRVAPHPRPLPSPGPQPLALDSPHTRPAQVGASGMLMLANVTDGGKTNGNGRISYSALLPHRNPLLCAIFAKGVFFGWRFLSGCMGEGEGEGRVPHLHPHLHPHP